ncbi:hypothetical protein NDU88_007014 [Pleurodeles waltl]|uniref:Uncharacterized protein n=1 Tax=Pleurodeles waltl TaxID=8319 RepID=A0AAV7N4R5_PLEWA|nr:hypothetical protein NDU88_007014 [Pleurodeles waltl]
MQLWDGPPQDQEHELPKIIAETYSSIGRDSLGARPTKSQFQEKRSERGGCSERRTEYMKPRHESQGSTEVSVKKEEKPPPNKNPNLKRKKWQQLQFDMPLKKRALLKNKKWALALLDSVAEVTIVRQNLLEHLEVQATDDFLQVETADMRVSTPDRV